MLRRSLSKITGHWKKLITRPQSEIWVTPYSESPWSLICSSSFSSSPWKWLVTNIHRRPLRSSINLSSIGNRTCQFVSLMIKFERYAPIPTMIIRANCNRIVFFCSGFPGRFAGIGQVLCDQHLLMLRRCFFAVEERRRWLINHSICSVQAFNDEMCANKTMPRGCDGEHWLAAFVSTATQSNQYRLGHCGLTENTSWLTFYRFPRVWLHGGIRTPLFFFYQLESLQIEAFSEFLRSKSSNIYWLIQNSALNRDQNISQYCSIQQVRTDVYLA